MSSSTKRFRVAFSFAGEKREFVSRVAANLAGRFGEEAILYDKFHEAEFGRRDLGRYLPKLYHDQSDLVVVVVCPDYKEKEWCGLEWDAIFGLLKARKDDEVMLCRFDHATVEGLYVAGFVDLDNKTPELAATRILERLALNEGQPKDHFISASVEDVATSSAGDFRAAPSRLSSGSDLLVGRENELNALYVAWSGPEKKNVVTIVAWGGVGKTSLVARWAANTLAKENHGGVERYFDWSFYSQGTRTEGDATGADKAASADIFIKEALEFFGDPSLAASNAGAWQKGERLARLVAEHRTLLILDGLEPLQDARSGELRDKALLALLRGLAVDNLGLCLVTTRQRLPELNPWHATTAPEWELAKLSIEAGAELLKQLGVKGTAVEREQVARDVKGHALTLTLLGKYLAEAHSGDIRKRDLVSLTEADYEETSGHAFHVMEAYEQWLEKDGRLVEVAILRLLGLFDRPATPDCLAALRQTPPIRGLTDMLVQITDAKWNLAVKRLVQLGLVEEQPWKQRHIAGYDKDIARRAMAAAQENLAFPLGEPQATSVPRFSFNSVDAHPLVREHFGRQVREKTPDLWRAAHSRLFEHLREFVPYWPCGLDGLQPLYEAVAHGCQAGRYQETCLEVYLERILRGASGPIAFYSTKKLGAIGADLAAIGSFFIEPWTRPSTELDETTQAWLLNQAAMLLLALGRLIEAREPVRISIERHIQTENWEEAASSTNNLSELDLTLGDVQSAVHEAEQSVAFADRSHNNAFQRMRVRTTHAYALQQAGQTSKALKRFEEAEAMQRARQPYYPVLYSVWGFWFCDLLIGDAERAAWRTFLANRVLLTRFDDLSPLTLNSQPNRFEGRSKGLHVKRLRDVEQRATKALDIVLAGSGNLLDIALNYLNIGRVALYQAILERSLGGRNSELLSQLDNAVDGLHRSGNMDEIPRGLLTRAWLLAALGRNTNARADLDDAQQLAERGPMPLYIADIQLHRARLFFRDDLDAARADLKQARVLIEKCGYLRRMPELEDAEKVIFAAK